MSTRVASDAPDPPDRPDQADDAPDGPEVGARPADPNSARNWRLLILAGGIVYGAIATMALMARSPIVPQYPPEIARLSPFRRLAGLFHGSPAMLIWVFVGLTVAAFLIAFRAWRLSHNGEAVRLAFAGAILFSGLLIFTPPIISQDVYSYASYGRMLAIHQKNPYMNGPSSIPDDPTSNYVGRMWWEMPSVYGPVAQLSTAAIAFVVRDFGAYVLALKISATLTLWIGLWLLVDLGRHLGRSPTIAIVVVGWNPLVLIHIAGGGHNDIFMAVALLAALALHMRKRENLALVALGLGAMVKFLAGVPIILYLVLMWRESDPEQRVRRTAKSVALLAGMALVGYLPFWNGSETFGAAMRVGGLSSDISIPSVVGRITALIVHTAGLRFITDGQLIFAARVAGFVIFVAYFIHLARNLNEDSQLPEVWGKALLAYCLTSGYLLPWYLVWAILPLALAPESMALRVALLAGFAYSFTQLPSGYVLLTPEIRKIGEWIGLAVAPILIAGGIAYFWFWRRDREASA